MPDSPGEFVKKHYEAVYRYCYRRCRNQNDAQDVTQETFLRYLRTAGQQRKREKPLAYLFTIARNICIDRSRTDREYPVDDIASIAEQHATSIHSARECPEDSVMKLLIATLPTEQQEIIELTYDQGFGVGEIAASLGISRFTVSRQLKSSLETLRLLLDERQDHA